jgi:hypothetical protein
MFAFSSASLADENNGNIFVGHLADENTGHATVFPSAIWPTKIMGSCLKKQQYSQARYVELFRLDPISKPYKMPWICLQVK